MKVTHITDIDKFFEVIDSCKGRVELVTGEGDRLNLKSKLSQYVSLAAFHIPVLIWMQNRTRMSVLQNGYNDNRERNKNFSLPS